MKSSAPVSTMHSKSLTDYFRCADVPYVGQPGPLNSPNGFFRFGSDVVCYGQSIGKTRSHLADHLYDASREVQANGSGLLLTFDLSQVADNLR